MGRPGFWIPKDISGNVSLIVSTTTGDNRTIEELCDVHSFPSLKIDLITEKEERVLCDTLLKENSKVLDASIIDMICSGRSTNNPLFLRIVIDELCVYGSYRGLENEIANLTQCKCVRELFSKYIDRLQNDFKVTTGDKNIVQDVFCALVFVV